MDVKAKAKFVANVINKLVIDNALSVPERAEKVLSSISVGSVVVKAVGQVENIYKTLRNCSTWNNFVLLKGARWVEEWGGFSASRYYKEIIIEKELEVLINNEKIFFIKLKKRRT